MIVLRIVELGCRLYFCSDGSKSTSCQRSLINVSRCLREPLLLVGVSVDARSVRRSPVITLPHALRRVVVLPEELEQIGVGDLVWVKDHPYHFGVTGRPAAHLVIGRVLCKAGRIANLQTVTN